MTRRARSILKGFILGNLEVSDLEKLGITVKSTREGVVITEDTTPVFKVSPQVLMEGYSVAKSRNLLRPWATVILGSSTFDLSDLETTPAGVELLESLWEASLGRGGN